MVFTAISFDADISQSIDRQRIANAPVDIGNASPHHGHANARHRQTGQDRIDDAPTGKDNTLEGIERVATMRTGRAMSEK